MNANICTLRLGLGMKSGLFLGGAPKIVCKGKILLNTLMASVTCMHFSMQEEDHILEYTNAKCHLCTLQSTCRPLCNIGIHTPHNTIENTHDVTL